MQTDSKPNSMIDHGIEPSISAHSCSGGCVFFGGNIPHSLVRLHMRKTMEISQIDEDSDLEASTATATLVPTKDGTG